MPCFHFDLQRGDVINRDEEGADFPSVDTAREEAIVAAREILSAAIRFSHEPQCDAVLVTDCDRTVLARVLIADALPLSLRQIIQTSS